MSAAEAARKLAPFFETGDNDAKDLIEILQEIQNAYNYLPEDLLVEVAERIDVPLIEVCRVANFYSAFSLTPRGDHHLKVCMGTACHVRGAPRMVDEIEKQLSLRPGETASDQTFSVESVSCVGCCAVGPVVVLDDEFKGHMNSLKLRKLLKTIDNRDKSLEVL
jgi:NADH-quinone oxidoreductase subunit E